MAAPPHLLAPAQAREAHPGGESRRVASGNHQSGGEAMTRVLMGDFEALHRLGLEDILRVDGIELVDTGGAGVLDRLLEALPDVIVLDLDKRSTGELVHVIVHRFPRVKVVACSSQHPMMRVFPPLHYGEFYESDLDPALLTSAVQA
jgi:DNA-binding NarL/FixJ family response regulator